MRSAFPRKEDRNQGKGATSGLGLKVWDRNQTFMGIVEIAQWGGERERVATSPPQNCRARTETKFLAVEVESPLKLLCPCAASPIPVIDSYFLVAVVVGERTSNLAPCLSSCGAL